LWVRFANKLEPQSSVDRSLARALNVHERTARVARK
jgi:hypothetical protein